MEQNVQINLDLCTIWMNIELYIVLLINLVIIIGFLVNIVAALAATMSTRNTIWGHS